MATGFSANFQLQRMKIEIAARKTGKAQMTSSRRESS